MDDIAYRVLRFDRFALDLTRGCLREGERDIDLPPKAFDVLRHLVENAGRLVPKQELFETVWPNVVVTDDSLVQCIRELRDKLGDAEHRLIATVSRRGYRLDAAVTATTQPLRESGHAIASEAPRISAAAAQPNLARWTGRAVLASAIVALATATYFMVDHARTPAAPDRPLSAGTAPAQRPSFKDCEICPEMVALPAGSFMMGSPPDDFHRLNVEGPPRPITIARSFAIGRFEITVDEFAAFAADTKTLLRRECLVVDAIDREPPTWKVSPEASFRRPGFEVTGLHPAGCMSWHDAQAYVAWLQRRTGKPYRLPSEAEWEYAARAGTTTRFSFGDDETKLCEHARFADLSTDFAWRGGCRGERAAFGSQPVGSKKPNPWGLHDMHGNVWEWVEGCWTADPSAIPTDGSALMRPGNCETGVVRGGSWLSGVRRQRSAVRFPGSASAQFQQYGFRVALSLKP